MKSLITLFIAAIIFTCCASVVEGGKKWAFLVAGSRLYQNYRHQADVAHAFQIMKKNGIPLENIIVMMYDDIAHHHLNPYPGELINEPHGPNVYTGVKIDYRAQDVTAANFLKVLQGDAEGMKGIGTGRVIDSTSEDNVFVYYADHGNKGLISFPLHSPSLYSKDLLAAINNMHQQKKYKKMVFYIEACYSGSMFIRRLPKDIGVFAMTAANDHESSWACFFDDKRRTSLADEFSYRWMKDTEGHSPSKRTLDEQYLAVKKLVKFSHPSLFGDTDGMGGITIGEFQGNPGSLYRANATTGIDLDVGIRATQWDVPYMSLLLELQKTTTTQHRLEIVKKMIGEETMKQKIRQSLVSIASKFVRKPLLMLRPISLEPSLAEDQCYEESIMKYERSCYRFNEYSYALKDLHMFANLCHRGVSIEKIQAAIDEVCFTEVDA